MIRASNAGERKFVEVKRRARPMGVFSDKTKILFAVSTYENYQQGIHSPFPATNILT